MKDLFKLVKDIEKRIISLDDRMEYYVDIKNALERSKAHLKMGLEALASANSYPNNLAVREANTFELYGHKFLVDYTIFTYEDGSRYIELNHVCDDETKEEEKYLSKNIEEKLKQLILN